MKFEAYIVMNFISYSLLLGIIQRFMMFMGILYCRGILETVRSVGMRACMFHTLRICDLTFQICKQIRLLLVDLCQEYGLPIPNEVFAIDSYLASKVHLRCLVYSRGDIIMV